MSHDYLKKYKILKRYFIQEFPQHKEKNYDLEVSVSYFRILFEEYNKVNHEILKYEKGAEATQDDHLNKLRMKRVYLED